MKRLYSKNEIMSTKDEKDWLRAILEGRVKPGDAEWERIWQDENFTGVRRVLREVGMRKKDEPGGRS